MNTDIYKPYPQEVFKFYAPTDYNIEAFTKHYLFPSHPYHLNDLMDSNSYNIDMRDLSYELYDELKKQIINQAPLIVNGELFHKLTPQTDKDYKILQKAILDCYFCFGGIVSLATQNRFSELMWSHYTNNETGYMIEFDTTKLLNSILLNKQNRIFNNLIFKPVQYKELLISVSCKTNPNIHYINRYNTTQKNKEWSYEKEWRMIVTSYPFLGIPNSLAIQNTKYNNNKKRKLYYSSDAIKRIYLGKKFWGIENIDQEIRIGKNYRQYIVKNHMVTFIKELCEYNGKIYMGGSCDCAEFKFGTDKITINEKRQTPEFNPNYYYEKRAFELIKNIQIEGKSVIVEYDGNFLTSDIYFKD